MCNSIRIFCRAAQSGSRGISMVVLWLGVGGIMGGSGVWYSTVNLEGEESLQWKRAISGWIPTNIFSKVSLSRGLRRIYRRS